MAITFEITDIPDPGIVKLEALPDAKMFEYMGIDIAFNLKEKYLILTHTDNYRPEFMPLWILKAGFFRHEDISRNPYDISDPAWERHAQLRGQYLGDFFDMPNLTADYKKTSPEQGISNLAAAFKTASSQDRLLVVSTHFREAGMVLNTAWKYNNAAPEQPLVAGKIICLDMLAMKKGLNNSPYSEYNEIYNSRSVVFNSFAEKDPYTYLSPQNLSRNALEAITHYHPN